MQDAAPALIGTSDAVRILGAAIAAASASDAKVLITGETGTGKEVVAHLVHAQGARARRPLIALNCASIPDALLESEMFGYERGSFSGAETDRAGLFTRAHGGTVFLDEIGETSPRMQAALLRFLDSGEIGRVGGGTRTHVDVRLIAATNRDLEKRIHAGAFRLDVFYRLNVLPLHTTALRERREDIPLLLDHFLNLSSLSYQSTKPTLSPGAMQALVRYEWPGNVRELKNVAERLLLRWAGQTIQEQDLSRELSPATSRGERAAPASSAFRVLPRVAHLYRRMAADHESFRTVVQEPFRAYALTRNDVGALVRRGLQDTRGNYKALIQLFNMDARSYAWMLNLVRTGDGETPSANGVDHSVIHARRP
jgi:transcriptional regulator with PAS, ATPase and Fis domain